MILTDYMRAAMKRATYEVMEEDEGYFGSIPGCLGLWASEATLEACRDELRSVLESWLLVKLRHNDTDFTIYDSENLNPPPPSVDPADLPDPVLTGAA